MAQLPLQDDQRHTLTCHLNGVRVAELVQREAAAHSGGHGEVSQSALLRLATTLGQRSGRR